jgi:hypothetical protein
MSLRISSFVGLASIKIGGSPPLNYWLRIGRGASGIIGSRIILAEGMMELNICSSSIAKRALRRSLPELIYSEGSKGSLAPVAWAMTSGFSLMISGTTSV